MRAVCMFLLSVGAKIAGRIYDMPTGMAAAAILILMENPAYLLDGGFLLSFGSVIGIGCVWPLVQEGMDVLNRKKRSEVNEKGKIRNKLLMSFLASGVMQLTTLPIVLWFYGEVSVMGIFLNLLVLPTVGDCNWEAELPVHYLDSHCQRSVSGCCSGQDYSERI